MFKKPYIWISIIIVIISLSGFYFSDNTYYISHADFNLPNTTQAFFEKVFYVWSAANGAVNIDGILRFFARLPVVLFAFVANNSVGISYFYILFSVILSLISFYSFSRYFLKIKSTKVLYIFSFLYVFNPVFLGNISKIGLSFSASLVLLALVFAKLFFGRYEIKYLFGVLLTIVFSLIHPFTTLINIFILAVYILFKIFIEKHLTSNVLLKFMFTFLVGSLMVVYAVLPILSVGSVSKGEISSTIGEDAGELVLSNIAKTNGLAEAYSLSKSVFLDYSFYSSEYKNIYFISIYILIFIAFLPILLKPKNATEWNFYLQHIFMAVPALFLILLSTGNSYLISERVNSFLVSLPVGWFFRSPLKWQLYIPIFIYTMLLISFILLHRRVKSTKYYLLPLILLLSLTATVHLSNDIYHNLLTPKENDLQTLFKFDYNDRNTIVIYMDSACKMFSKDHTKEFADFINKLKQNHFLVTILSDKDLIKQNVLSEKFKYAIKCQQDDEMLKKHFSLLAKVLDKLYLYQNYGVDKYITASNILFNIQNIKNLEDKYTFVNNTLHKDLDFMVSGEQKQVPAEKLVQIFENAESQDVNNEEVVDVENVGYKDTLYRNANKRDLVIKTTDDKSEIVATKKERLIVNGEELVDKDNTSTVFTLNDDYHNYYIKDGGTIIPFVNNARLNSEVPNEIYKTTVDNVVKNGDFNNSLWQDKVGDCNDYDKEPVLSMKKVLGEGENNYVLQLEATKHIACTSQKNIPVESNREYLVKFDYKPVNAKQAGFYLGFKNSSEGNYQSYSERLATPDYTRGEWQHYAKIIRIPQGTTDLFLYLYAYESDGEENNVVQYDNVSIQPVELVQTINPEEKKSFVKVDLPKANNGEYKFEYKDEQHNFANKIPNPSFEDGLWAKKVGDCNHYDDNPVLGMKKITVENLKTPQSSHSSNFDPLYTGGENKYALQFEATRHTACLSQKGIPVKGKTEYLFEFDYQGEKAKQAGYYIVFNDSNKTVINEKVPITEKGWQTFHKRFTTPSDATSMTLYIYGYSKDEKTKVITRYDNFKLIELPNIANRYYLVSESPVETAKPRETTYDLINPTKKLVHIKGATKPFYLTMSESYHDKWQAELNNNKVQGFFKSWVPFVKPDAISNDKHFKYMTFLNGWYVDPVELCESSKNNNLKTPQNSHSSNFDPLYTGGGQLKDGCTKNEDGSYDIEMVIEFTPQRYFYLGLLISGVTFISLISYLGYDWYRRRKNIL